MTTLRCPRDDTPLRPPRNGRHRCPQCLKEYVVDILEASGMDPIWDQRAPCAAAVYAVMEAARVA